MDERRHIEAAIAALESQRGTLEEATIDIAVGVLRSRLGLGAEPRREQRKLVTVLFGDVSGFTALAERTDPEKVTAAVNALWRSVDTTITEHGGTVDKHIGDAVMALFGAPTAHEDDAEQAVRAALAIQKTLANVTADVGWAEVELRMRIGLHTGPVHLGTVGTTGEYTAMGDTVNLASRLQSAAPEGGVLISSDTWRHVREVFDADSQPPIRVKGKSRPISVFEVRSERPAGWRRTTYELAGLETPLVGREETLRHLELTLDEVVQSGRGRQLLVTGDRGMGKSRVLESFRQRVLDSDRPILMLRARVDRDSVKVPYGLLRDLVSTRFRMLDSDSDAVALAKLENGLQELMDERPEETAHLIGHLVGLDPSHIEKVLGTLDDPRNLRDRAISSLTRLLQGLAEHSPILLALENLHLADEGSRHLVKKLCLAAADMPLFVLMSSRPTLHDVDPDFIQATSAQEVALEPLSDADAERLVADLLDRSGRADKLTLRRIVETAGGHPYYLEELIRMVLEGDPREDSADRQEKGKPDFDVPPTLAALLQARLDALPEPARSLLQKASVIGRVFWDSSALALQTATSREEPIEQLLNELIRREIIRETPQSSFDGLRQFSFRSSLLHEVTYETVLLRDRRILHEHVARWLSEQAGDAAPIWAARIADHWERAEMPRAASAWFLKAGEHAKRTSAFGEAEVAYFKALEHMKSDASAGALRVSAHEGLSEMRLRQGKVQAAMTASEAMLAEAEAMDDQASQARAWWALCRAHQAVSRLEDALDAARRAVKLAHSSGASVTLVRAMIEHGQCLFRLGRLDEAATVLHQALESGVREDLKPEQALALRLQGAVQARLGRFGPAERHAERALELLREVGDAVRATACLLSLGELARVRGDLRRAAGRYDEALELARRLGVSGHELVGMNNLGGVRVALGEIESGEAMLRVVLDRAPAGWYGLPETWRFLAEARLAAGQLDDAIETGVRALSLCLGSGNAELIGPAWRVLAQAASAASRPVALDDGERDARACFEESRRVLAEANLNPEEARTLREWARHEIHHGDRALGDKLWSQAREWFGLLGMDIEVARTPEQAPAA